MNVFFSCTDKYLLPSNVSEEHALSPAGQYSPAPVIVQTSYNYRYVTQLYILFFFLKNKLDVISVK